MKMYREDRDHRNKRTATWHRKITERKDMGRNALMYMAQYTNGEKKAHQFSSVREAREFFRNEGDHIVDWWAVGES